jgi:hypothetical protein
MKQANRMVGASAVGAAMLIGLCTPSARAAFVVDLTRKRGATSSQPEAEPST